ncbi:MAG: hypothetical protein D6712_15600 [Chloroflexi bacterium]|nr:MAG: hypothetical protein D6712_15600 [Chloroflexota bacterium]
MEQTADIVGRVLRANTRGFACGTHSNQISDKHDFGAFVKAPIANSNDAEMAIGLIYKVDIQDDQLVNELVMGENIPDNVLLDQRNNRMIPVEVSVLSIGFTYRGTMVHGLPPRPPMSLAEVVLCTPADVHLFTQELGFIRLVLNATEVPADDLLAAALRYAVWKAYPPEDERVFLTRAGRELARQLSGDMKRLAHLLNLIHP